VGGLIILKKNEFFIFLKFIIVGASNTIVNYFVFFILFDLFNIYYIISNISGYLVALTNSYIWNLRWTFKKDHSFDILYKFFVVNVISLTLNLVILKTLVENAILPVLVAQIFAILGALLVNFTGNRLWTFKKKDIK